MDDLSDTQYKRVTSITTTSRRILSARPALPAAPAAARSAMATWPSAR